MREPKNEKGLAGKILFGLLLGAVAGVALNFGFGSAPWLAFASLTLGVAGLPPATRSVSLESSCASPPSSLSSSHAPARFPLT